MTQDPETKNYMVVLGNTCKKCKYACSTIHFQRNFENWTSGNNNIDKFIQDTQLSAHDYTDEALKWIPYDRLCNIKCIAKGEFGKVYSKANLIDRNKVVALKSLNNSKNVTLEFMNEVKLFYYLMKN